MCKTIRKTCEGCGVEFEAPVRWNESGRRYCTAACSKMGDRNPNKDGKSAAKDERHQYWKGENVGIDALHTYVRRRLPSDGRCTCCGQEKRLDLANISGEYKRELSDWEWLCRRCHMIKDGRLDRLKTNSKNWRDKNLYHSNSDNRPEVKRRQEAVKKLLLP